MRVLLLFAALAAPASVVAQSVPEALFDSMRSAPLSVGAWRYRTTPLGSEAAFGDSFVIRCNAANRQVTLLRPQAAATPTTPMMVATDSMMRSLPASGAILSATDPLLDAIAFSRGRFVVTGGGGEALVIPAWPEAARAIEDCRN